MSDKTQDLTPQVFSDWMHYLPEDAKNKPFQNILLPGTYNSVSNSINLDDMTKYIESSEGKENNITDQLLYGIRYLDMSVFYDKSDSEFYFTGYSKLCRASEILLEIANFVKQHPDEYFILNINASWDNRYETRPHLKEFGKVIKEYLGEDIAQNYIPSISSINDLKKGGHVIISSKYEAEKLMDEQVVLGHNKNSDTYIDIEYIREIVSSIEKHQYLDVIDFIGHRDAHDMLLHGNKYQLSKTLNSHLDSLIAAYDKEQDIHHIQAITLDHPTCENIESIILSNYC